MAAQLVAPVAMLGARCASDNESKYLYRNVIGVSADASMPATIMFASASR